MISYTSSSVHSGWSSLFQRCWPLAEWSSTRLTRSTQINSSSYGGFPLNTHKEHEIWILIWFSEPICKKLHTQKHYLFGHTNRVLRLHPRAVILVRESAVHFNTGSIFQTWWMVRSCSGPRRWTILRSYWIDRFATDDWIFLAETECAIFSVR